jgi:precorrin-2/cobalt-factor-2 C20-methyltransferase
MQKTSVYLPAALKEDLRRLASRSGRSEAELIRLAITRLVGAPAADDATTEATTDARADAPPRRIPGPRLVGVGVGPSVADLVTLRAVRVLRSADRVFAAATAADAIGRAEAVVREVAPEVPVDRLVFGAVASDAVTDDAAAAVVAALDLGHSVAFVTLGDPNVYTVFPAVARAVRRQRPDVPVTSVPGIMAFQELAAQTGTVVAEGDEHVELLTMAGDGANLDQALRDRHRTVVIYKGGKHVPSVAASLARRRRLSDAVIGELLGLPGGRSGPVREVADRPASYLATMVIPAARVGS